MKEEKLKEAFTKIKEDIYNLRNETSQLKQELEEIKNMLKSLNLELSPQKKALITPEIPYPTYRQISPTINAYPTDNPTVPQEIRGLKNPFIGISTGNEGVKTDRQTDRQTDEKPSFLPNPGDISKDYLSQNIEKDIKEAAEILGSLDTLKKQIRLKFKKITPREMAVFSSIYALEEEDPENCTYKAISKRLGLSESSIRDYLLHLINKGIPIKKAKINNKKILLSISPDLKNIASLSTLLKLRDL